MAHHLIHKRSNVSGKTPSVDTIEYGELAINYNSQTPTIHIKNNKNQISSFIDEKEIIARIEGKSDNSNPRTDPFKYLGSFSGINGDDLKNALDALHTTNPSENIEGLYRATLIYAILEIQCIAIHYATDRWMQVLKSPYRWVKSTSKFDIVTEPRYRILYRIFENPNGDNSTENNVWSDWHDVEQDLEDRIAQESTRAIQAEQTNTTVINNEITRAKAEETAIRKLISDLIGEAPETLDTIHEIAEWINNDTSGAAAMAKQISANTMQISANTEANEELLLRLQGDSENSRATTDPFVNLGSMRGIKELVAYAETIIDDNEGVVDTALLTGMISGVYRAFVNTSMYEMKLNVLTLHSVLTQTITGLLSLTDEELSVGTTDVMTVERYFQNGKGWSDWKIVASAEKLKELQSGINKVEEATSQAILKVDDNIKKLSGENELISSDISINEEVTLKSLLLLEQRLKSIINVLNINKEQNNKLNGEINAVSGNVQTIQETYISYTSSNNIPTEEPANNCLQFDFNNQILYLGDAATTSWYSIPMTKLSYFMSNSTNTLIASNNNVSNNIITINGTIQNNILNV